MTQPTYLDDGDPFDDPSYQDYLASCAKDCRCCPVCSQVCAGVLAGGLCDDAACRCEPDDEYGYDDADDE